MDFDKSEIKREDQREYRLKTWKALWATDVKSKNSSLYSDRTEEVYSHAIEAAKKAKPLTVLVAIRKVKKHCEETRGGTKVAKQLPILEKIERKWREKFC